MSWPNRGGGSTPIVVTGGDLVNDVKTATIYGGTGAIQWARYDPTTGAYIEDIAGQTGTTYTITIADIDYIVGAYLTAYQAFSHGVTPVSLGEEQFMFASNRTMFASNASGVVAGNVFECVRFTYRSPPYATRNHRFCFAAFYVKIGASGNETALGNDIFYEGVVAVVGGVSYPITVNGSTSFNVANGTYVWTDEVTFNVPSGTVVELRIADQVAAGGFRPLAYCGQSTDGNNAGSTTQSARLTSGSFSVPSRLTVITGPVCIVGKGWELAGSPPVPLIVGDSIGWGANDWNLGIYPDGVCGHIPRALNDGGTSTRYAYANFCAPGTRLSNLNAAAGEWALRKQMLLDVDYPFTSIISEMGINTIANVASTALAIAQFDPAMAFLKTMGNKPVVQTTFFPQTSDATTNKWTTVADQVASSSTVHIGLTDYIKTLPANVDAYIDVEPALADVGSPTKWKVPPQAGTLAANVSSGTTFTVTVTSPETFAVDDFVVVGAGTANVEQRKVYIVTGTYPNLTITVNSAFTKAHLTGDAVKAQYTEDGTHPSTPGAILGMAPIITAKNADVIV